MSRALADPTADVKVEQTLALCYWLAATHISNTSLSYILGRIPLLTDNRTETPEPSPSRPQRRLWRVVVYEKSDKKHEPTND